MASTRHWDTCTLNPAIPGVERFFFSFLWPFSVTAYCLLGHILFLGLHFQFDNPKAAAQVAVRSSVLVTVKQCSNKSCTYSSNSMCQVEECNEEAESC